MTTPETIQANLQLNPRNTDPGVIADTVRLALLDVLQLLAAAKVFDPLEPKSNSVVSELSESLTDAETRNKELDMQRELAEQQRDELHRELKSLDWERRGEQVSDPAAGEYPRLECIEWADATNFATWEHVADIAKWATTNTFTVRNVGYVIHEDDDCVVLAARYAPDIDGGSQAGLYERLPKQMIVARWPLHDLRDAPDPEPNPNPTPPGGNPNE